MTQSYRLPSGAPPPEVRFVFDGREMKGRAGDTLAAALLANGVGVVGRSFKYHRPRGVMAAGVEEPNALVTVVRGGGRETPNLRATVVEIYEGLVAWSQNAWPSVGFDVGAMAGWLAPVLGAGFYYKTFKWPVSFWKRVYEPLIRAAAGLGRAPVSADPDRYARRYAHCDVLVIGGGPAGLAAAKAADGRVILCDEQAELGGSLLSRAETTIDGVPARNWVARGLDARVTALTRTTAFGWYPDGMVGLVERVTDHLPSPDPGLPRERLLLVRAKRVVIAAGAIERPLVFPGNDRPGIMLAGAAEIFLARYGVTPGRRAVVATSHDRAWHTAFSLAKAGVAVAAILDTRAEVGPDLRALARDAGIPVWTGTRIVGTGGRNRVRFVETLGAPPVIPCDTVLMSGGWTPSVHLFSQSRGRLRYDADSGVYLPDRSAAAETSVGACAGEFDLAACLAAGHRAGGGEARAFAVEHEPAFGAASPPEPAAPHPLAFVDFQNDVTTKDLAIATGEGFRSIEHIKRYTTTGMATDQGKTSNLNALVSAAAAIGRAVPDVGLTTFRPPYSPVTFGAFAGAARGELFDPVRRTPIDDRDAVFEDVGTWKRAWYFPREGETMHAAVARECRAVRTDVGLFDASTLGKIEVVGPDAAAFLNLLYTGDFESLAVGRCKYAVLLGEDGFVRDDGVIARLSKTRFHVTTTTGGAAFVLNHMEDYLQTEFPALRVWLTSTTEHWAVIGVQGPRAAEVLGPYLENIDLTALPHMSVAEGLFASIPARLFRVSFTGELGFELNVPARFGRAAWGLLRESGATRYGTEAMHVLRAEKGYFVVGQETDGTVTPDDLGLSWTIARRKPDFVGKRSLARPDMRRPDRWQLVGLLSDQVLEEGARVTATDGTSLGHVTSAYRSETQGHPIALALVAGGRSRIGGAVEIPMPNGKIAAQVVPPVSYDPKGERLTAPIATPPPRVSVRLTETPVAVPFTAPCAGVSLSLAPETSRFNIRTSVPLAPPLRAAVHGAHDIFWLGPDEYLAMGDGPPDIVADSIVDVSHRTAAIRLEGAKAAWCINAFCPLDLDDLPPGACTRTVFEKTEIVLWRLSDTIFHIEAARSLVPYVWALLEDARREFLPPPPAC